MSYPFTVFRNSTGQILRSGYTHSDDIASQALEGESVLAVLSNDALQYVEAGELVDMANKPSINHVFDWVAKVWIDPRTLQDLKTTSNALINAARLDANSAGFAYSGKEFSTDPLSRSDIDGINGYAGLYNALPPNWAGAWKAQDNTYLAVPDLDAWKAFYSAMVEAGNTNFAKAQALKAQLAAATTPEEVEAITW